MEEKIGDTYKTYYYLTSTSWEHVLSVLLLQELDNFQKSMSYNSMTGDSKAVLQVTC